MMAETILYALSSSRLARKVTRRRGLDLPHVGGLPGCQFVRVGPWLPGTPRSLGFRDLVRPIDSTAAPAIQHGCDDAVFIVFTSGTTARPKAVVHTARSIAATLDASHLISDLNAESVVMTDQLHSVLPALLAGSCVFLPRAGAQPEDILRLIMRCRPTHIFAVPSALHRIVTLCQTQSTTLPDRLRHVVLGAGPTGSSLLLKTRSVLPASTRVTCVYGLTEMAPVAAIDMRREG